MDDILFFAKDDSKTQCVMDTLKEKGIAIHHEGTAEARIITALGLDSSLLTRLSTPAKVGPLPKDVNGAPASGNIN
ncbi:hypothetical protein ACHAW6_003015 [Cyclotella cf. meneghiniana]